MTLTSLSEPLRVGRLVFSGRYELRQLLGMGGMGHVWLAWDTELSSPRALKFLTGVFGETREELAKLRAEAARCQDLTHENIVRVYDFVRDEELAALSMEYIDGVTLKELRKHQPSGCFEEATLRPWVRQLCHALAHAHAHGVVHLDLKPSNLMLTTRGQVKVTDFGISRSLWEAPETRTEHPHPSGTPAFMSPGRFHQLPPCVSDDVYSLGATLHALLVGKPPFSKVRHGWRLPAPSISQAREAVGALGKPVSADWEETILACLAKDPDARPRSIVEVADRLGLGTEGMARTEEPGAINMEVVRVRSLQHPSLAKEIDEELTVVAPIKQPGWRRWIAQAAMFAAAATLVFAEVFHETYRAHRSRNDHESPRSRLDSGGADDIESRSNPLS